MKAQPVNERAGADVGPVVSPARPLAGAPAQDVILGVDPGLATTGWGVITKTGAETQVVAYGAILSPARADLPDRLRRLHRELGRLMDQYDPGVLAIEELFFTKFAISIASTAQARGVILLTAAERGLPIVEYNPRRVKLSNTGFGSASKIQMQSMLQRHFKLPALPQPDDAADALAIALCHAQTQSALIPKKVSKEAFEAELAARAGVQL